MHPSASLSQFPLLFCESASLLTALLVSAPFALSVNQICLETSLSVCHLLPSERKAQPTFHARNTSILPLPYSTCALTSKAPALSPHHASTAQACTTTTAAVHYLASRTLNPHSNRPDRKFPRSTCEVWDPRTTCSTPLHGARPALTTPVPKSSFLNFSRLKLHGRPSSHPAHGRQAAHAHTWQAN